MIKIVSFKICPFVQRVTALLAAKSVVYEIEYINLSHKPQWFLEISPHAQVPLLITDHDDVLFESDAIVEYIDDAMGPPLSSPDLVQKAHDRAWSYLASKHYLGQCSAQRSPDATTLEKRAAKLSTALAKVELTLGDSPYARGHDLGMVDIAWLPLLHRAALIAQYSGYDFLAAFPKVQQWQQNLLATGLAEQSVPADFEERFTAFYLAASTYLGQLAQKHDPLNSSQSPGASPHASGPVPTYSL